MANNTSFIIPVNVQAIRALGGDTNKFNGPTVDFHLIGGQTLLGAQIDQNLPGSASTLGEGVHLHWSLPSALTHGVHEGSADAIVFPRVPDRWLVTRYFSWLGNKTNSNDPNQNNPFQVKQWMIESNRISTSDDHFGKPGHMSTPIPWAPSPAPTPSGSGVELPTGVMPTPPSLSCRFLGMRSDYNANWQPSSADPSQYDPNLTAVSYYGPSFSAYYQNSAQVFGLSDDFSDLGYGQGNLFGPIFNVSYHIIGWYSATDCTQEDILAQMLADAMAAYDQNPPSDISKLEFFNQYVEKTLKWQLFPDTQGVPPNDVWPTGVQSIFNGMALDIQWYEAGGTSVQAFLPKPQEVADSLNLQIAIGNNSAEAISALISSDKIVNPEGDQDNHEPYPELEKHIELLFNAFQQDLLRRLAGSDPSFHIGQIEEYLHTLEFSKQKGGSLWTVRAEPPKSGNTIKLKKTAGNPDGAGQVALPLAAAELLSLLNAAQENYDRQTDEAHSRQTQAYLDWTAWGLALASSNSDADNYRSYLESELMQVLTQSAAKGVLSSSSNGNDQAQQLEFQPIWTVPNTSAPALIHSLASAQYQLELQLPGLFAAVRKCAADALAILNAGSAANASAILQSMLNDPGIQGPMSILNSLLSGQGAGNPLLNALNQSITALNEEVQMLQKAIGPSNNENNPGIADVITAFENGGGLTHLGNFMSTQKSKLFQGGNLVDTQQIWPFIESANYDIFALNIIGAKLVAAQNLLTDTQNGINQTVLVNLANAQTSINGNLSTLYTRVSSLSSRSNTIIGLLNAVTTDITPAQSALESFISDLDSYLNSSINQSVGQALQQAWQPLLTYLPTAHQVLILAQLMQETATLIDPANSLQRSAAEPYWQPNDPVVVLTQPDSVQQSLLPVNRNGSAQLFPCRQSSDLLTALTLNNGASTQNISAGTLAGRPKAPKAYPNLSGVQDMVQQLLYEGYFLAPQAAADLISAANFASTEISNLQNCQSQLFAAIKSAQQNQLTPPTQQNLPFNSKQNGSTLTATFEGTLPYYVGLNLLADTVNPDNSITPNNPYLPLFLAWTGDFETFQVGNNNALPPNFLSKKFRMDQEDVELAYITPAPPLQCSGGSPAPISLSGQITLSGQSGANLRNQIRVYFMNAIEKDISKGEVQRDLLTNDFQKDLYDVYQYFSTKTILSQGLNGFNAGLMQQLPLLQTPLNNLSNSDSTTTPLFIFLQQTWNNPQWNKVTVGQTSSSLFLPMRAGRLRLKKLYIVDAFGRYFQMGSDSSVVQNNMIVAGSLEQDPKNLLAPGCFPSDTNIKDLYLPPRFLQPARLSFNWLSACAEEGGENTFVERTSQPAFSPILGWMLPNHLDDSLVLYDAGGDPLGSLGIEGAGRTLTWRSVPTAGSKPATGNGYPQMLQDIQPANLFLQDFLKKFAFPSNGESYFQQFLNTLDQSQNFIHSPNLQEDKGLAVLIGRPFVLARARMRIELQGLPPAAMDWQSFSHDVDAWNNQTDTDPSTWNDYDLSKRSQANNLAQIAVPVNLGQLNQFDDGLVGFFLNDNWDTFYTPLSQATTGSIQSASRGVMQLLPNYGAASSALTPVGSGQAVAGIPQQELIITLVMDPRAAVHASTGILPVNSIQIPPAQYQSTLQKLMVYFLTNPVLRPKQSFDIPLPTEKGYQWSWVQPGLEVALEPNALDDRAHFGYSPQQLLDGWLKLTEDPSNSYKS